jgi:nitrogen regulatory protein P-II 1
LKRITAYIRPHRLEHVKSAVAILGVTGMNVTDVRGTGNAPERPGALGGAIASMPIRSRLSVVVADDIAEQVISAIQDNAHTGEPGDGKIILEDVLEALRIRTGERGEVGL